MNSEAPTYAAAIALPEPRRRILYRYLSLEYGLEVLQNGWWKVGRMSELNDPFDCRPRFVNDGSQPENFIDFVMEHWGLLSFSEAIRDPVIWSHYADRHRGIALRFDFTHAADPPQPVTYSNDIPVLKTSDIVEQRKITKEVAKWVHQTAYMTKAPSWSYEGEHRKIVLLDDCEMRGKHYFQAISGLEFQGVVIGAKCPVTLRDVERSLRIPRDVPVRRCQMNEASYQLDLVDSRGHLVDPVGFFSDPTKQ